MKEKIQCVGAMAAGVVVMAMVLVGGYGIVRLGIRAVDVYDPGAKIEAVAIASAPLMRTIGGQ